MLPLIYPQKLHFPIVPHIPQPQQRVQDEEDLASVALQVERKRFYVDVKRNHRGTFMKIAEVGLDGRKARILLTLGAASDIRDRLKDLIDVLDGILAKEDEEKSSTPEKDAETDARNSDNPNDGLIKSHVVNYRLRRYFLDLKKNKRGYFVRLTMLSTTNRVQLAVPSQGMLDLYNAINGLLDKWWDGSKPEEQKAVNLPESKFLRVDNRTLYFDSSYNRYGTYLRISEVRSSSRTAITIPSRSLFRFRDIINGLAEDLINSKMNKMSLEENPSTEPEPQEEPAVNGDAPS